MATLSVFHSAVKLEPRKYASTAALRLSQDQNYVKIQGRLSSVWVHKAPNKSQSAEKSSRESRSMSKSRPRNRGNSKSLRASQKKEKPVRITRVQDESIKVTNKYNGLEEMEQTLHKKTQ